MAWHITSASPAGAQPIEVTSTTQKHPLGTIVTARNTSNGTVGEFIYMTGVTSTVATSVVTYNAATFATTLAVVGAAISKPVAVAMSANVGSQYGWYQISGVASVGKTTATSFAAGVALGTTAGKVIAAATSNAVAGMIGAAIATGSASGSMTVMINRPHMSET